jgi:hypothetical protein
MQYLRRGRAANNGAKIINRPVLPYSARHSPSLPSGGSQQYPSASLLHGASTTPHGSNTQVNACGANSGRMLGKAEGLSGPRTYWTAVNPGNPPAAIHTPCKDTVTCNLAWLDYCSVIYTSRNIRAIEFLSSNIR